MSKKSARATALDILTAFETGKVWSQKRVTNAIRTAELDRRDAAFCTHLTGGVVQYKLLLDYHLSKLSKISLKKLETRVLCLLRLGAYQIIFSGGVRDAAAVNETVALVREPRTRGFCNAILRALTRVQNPLDIRADTLAEALSIRFSTPQWLVEELMSTIGDERAAAELDAIHIPPPVTAQVNTTKTTTENLAQALAAQGIDVRPGLLPDSLRLSGVGDLERLDAFAGGLFWVQDDASAQAVRALGLSDGDAVLDLCAAPGGKTFAAMTLAKNLKITSCDLTERKVDIIRSGAARLGFQVDCRTNDARIDRPDWHQGFDKIICDLPCSGLGIIRKKPDIKYKNPDDFTALENLQKEILRTAVSYLKPCGTMLYSTCTWRKSENEDAVDWLLSEHPELHLAAPPRTLWTGENGTDGFFICVLVKKDV